MPQNLAQILTQIDTASGGVAPISNENRQPRNALVDVLTERLTNQGKGISTSTSSGLQNSINEAISSTQTAGTNTNRALQSEREREVAFARDRAGATYDQALEGRTGYATQVAGLRELTETTEKSVRDLDKRYQEAILSNDAATASKVADLKIKKLEFQQQQEENFFNQLMGVANLQEQALNRAQQSEQFWEKAKQDKTQFALGLLQSNYQFEKNYGLGLQEIELKKQGLELEKQRNNISMAEYKLKLSQLNKEENEQSLSAKIVSDLRKEVTDGGKNVKDLDPSAYALWAYEKYGAEGKDISYEQIYKTASDAKTIFAEQGLAPRVNESSSSFGLGNTSFTRDFARFSGYADRVADVIMPGYNAASYLYQNRNTAIDYFTKPTN